MSFEFFLLLRLTVLAVLFISAYAQKAKPAAAYDRTGCETKFLKDEGFLPPTFPSKPPTSQCDALDTVVKETFTKLRREYEKIMYDGECMEKAYKKAKMQRFFILPSVYSKAEHLTQAQKDQKIKEVKEEEKRIANEILSPCIESKSFNQLFDFLYNSADDTDSKEDYCVRKYLLDNRLVDSHYNVKLNPKNIATAKVNCDALIKESRKDSESSFTDDRGYSIDKKICIKLAFQKGKYFDNVSVVSVLKGSSATAQQLTAERSKFTTAMVKFMKEITTCVGE